MGPRQHFPYIFKGAPTIGHIDYDAQPRQVSVVSKKIHYCLPVGLVIMFKAPGSIPVIF